MAKQKIITTQVKETPAGSINWKDAGKGLIMAVGVPLLTFVQEQIPSYDLDPIYKIAISALVVYILKQFSTSSVQKV